MRQWLVCGIVLGLMVSGCLQKDDASPSSPSTSATGMGPSSLTGNGTGAPSNQAPVANLTAQVGQGAASLQVSFALAGSDPDGDALNWTLSLGDGSANQTGADLPANLTHTYAAGGSYLVTFLVGDGMNTTSQTATLNLTAPAAVATFEPIDETRPWSVSFTGAAEYALGCQEDGLDCAYFEIPLAASGREFTMTFTATVPAAVYFIDHYKDGKYIETFIGGPGGHEIADVVPDGTTEFRAYATGGADFTAQLVIP